MTTHVKERPPREWSNKNVKEFAICSRIGCEKDATVYQGIIACGHTGPPLPLKTRVYRDCCIRYLYSCDEHKTDHATASGLYYGFSNNMEIEPYFNTWERVHKELDMWIWELEIDEGAGNIN